MLYLPELVASKEFEQAQGGGKNTPLRVDFPKTDKFRISTLKRRKQHKACKATRDNHETNGRILSR